MVDKITVNPLEVRGAGDIVSPKTSSDFSFYYSYIQQSTQLVNDNPMTVYQMTRWGNYTLVFDFEKFIEYTADLDSFPLKVTLKDRNDRFVVGKTLTCVVNGNISLSGVTNSRGMVTFNVPVTHDGVYYCTVNYYEKTSSSGGVGGVTKSAKVYVGVLNSIRLRGSTDKVMIGEESALVCNVDYLVDGDVYPAPNVPVLFYETYKRNLLRITSGRFVESGSVLPFTARLSDIDGSGIPGNTVRFFEEWDSGNFGFVDPAPAVQNGSVLGFTVRLSDSDGSGISGETIMFYEEYEPTSVRVSTNVPIIETDGVATVSASVRDSDGSLIQVADTPVSFYEQYTISNVQLHVDKSMITSNEKAGFSARVSDEDGSAVPDMTVYFYEEFTRESITVERSTPITSDVVSVLKGTVHDGDSRVRDTLVEFTKDFDSTDWGIFFDELSMDTVIGSGDEIPISATVYDDEDEPVEDVYVRFIADMIPEETIIPESEPEPEPATVGSVTLVGDGTTILSGYDEDTMVLTATVKDTNNNVMEDESVVFERGGTTLATKQTNSQGIATYTYTASGNGDVSFTATAGEVVSSAVSVEDCNYYSTTEYKQNGDYISLNIPLPSTFKLEFDIKPTSRSTSGWGSGCYLRLGADSDNGIWAGQLTSAGRHGLMPKPTGTTQYCTSNTVLSEDNHITVLFDGTTATYTCNNETVTISTSNLSKINAVVPTSNNGLKNIKIKPL